MPPFAFCNSLIDPSRTAATADRPAQLARDEFSLGKDPQKIPAENLIDVLLAVAAFQKFISDIRKHRNVPRAFGKIVSAVKVRPQADVVDARDLDDVIDVIDEPGKRQGR